jgi:hypothetical protein
LLLIAATFWAWYTDTPGPTAPHGSFIYRIVSAIIIIVVCALAIAVIRFFKRN